MSQSPEAPELYRRFPVYDFKTDTRDMQWILRRLSAVFHKILPVLKKIQKKYKISKKVIAKSGISMYTNKRCGMIAVKREVAGCQQ